MSPHGCVRLSEINARMLFNWTPMGTPVFIDLEKL
ncbi:L,D-transpeptidase [Vibrio rhizosphaerae]